MQLLKWRLDQNGLFVQETNDLGSASRMECMFKVQSSKFKVPSSNQPSCAVCSPHKNPTCQLIPTYNFHNNIQTITMINAKSTLLMLTSCIASANAFYWNSSSSDPLFTLPSSSSEFSYISQSSSCSLSSACTKDQTTTVTSQITIQSPSQSQPFPSSSDILSSSSQSQSQPQSSSQSSSVPTPWIEGSWVNGIPEWQVYIPQKSYSNFQGFELESLSHSDGFKFDSADVTFHNDDSTLPKSLLTDNSSDDKLSFSFEGFTAANVLSLVIPGELSGDLLATYKASFNLIIDASAGLAKRDQYQFTLSATVNSPIASSAASSSQSASSSNVGKKVFSSASSSEDYVDLTSTPIVTDRASTITTLTEGSTITRTLSDCHASSCSSYTVTEIVSYYTLSYSGSETVITTYYPLPTSNTISSGAAVSTTEVALSPSTTTFTTTSCSNSACSTYKVTELVSAYTTTISGQVTVITSYSTLSGSDEPTTTYHIPRTVTETLTSCSDGGCSTYSVTEIADSYTTTISGQVTVITSYSTLSGSDEPTSTIPSTIVETVTSCSAGICSTFATTELLPNFFCFC
ncbi:unnamed protein product [Ambrosiozyma monospora]|uniref:Unnamed protein product n=1 Tax=Ambrosiozyma monospora TaxID=43982 RepID=A0ACB5T5Z7_AMBMO|nr:unnamed protein product [Ambrosiozyma monospora]